jgi:hypothetical protein
MKDLFALFLPVTALAAYYSVDKYETGEVHDRIIRMKQVNILTHTEINQQVQETWAKEKSAGMFDQRHYPSWKFWRGRGSTSRKDNVKCKDGLAVVEPGNANQTFRCNNVCLSFRYD